MPMPSQRQIPCGLLPAITKPKAMRRRERSIARVVVSFATLLSCQRRYRLVRVRSSQRPRRSPHSVVKGSARSLAMARRDPGPDRPGRPPLRRIGRRCPSGGLGHPGRPGLVPARRAAAGNPDHRLYRGVGVVRHHRSVQLVPRERARLPAHYSSAIIVTAALVLIAFRGEDSFALDNRFGHPRV